jgi:acetolactate synthase-1/2/3 large subunit
VITVGYDPVEYDPEIWNMGGNQNIIHIDYNPTDIHLCYSPKIELIGHISSTLRELSTLLLPDKGTYHLPPIVSNLRKELLAKIDSGKTHSKKLMHPMRFVYDLRQNIDDNVIVVSDIGTHHMWLARYFFSYNPHHLLFSNGQQTLGVGLPWAMAACYASPGSTVISISGDGGFLFSAMELETAVREKLHFIHFVWCDGAYNMVEEQQQLKYGRTSAVHFGAVDIVKYAESFGAHGFLLNHPDEFIPVLNKAMQLEGPVLIQINMDYSDNHQLFQTLHPGIMH